MKTSLDSTLEPLNMYETENEISVHRRSSKFHAASINGCGLWRHIPRQRSNNSTPFSL